MTYKSHAYYGSDIITYKEVKYVTYMYVIFIRELTVILYKCHSSYELRCFLNLLNGQCRDRELGCILQLPVVYCRIRLIPIFL